MAALRPSKWADRKNVHHSGQVETVAARHWQIATIDMQHLTQAEQDSLASIMVKVRDGRAALANEDTAPLTIEHQPDPTPKEEIPW